MWGGTPSRNMVSPMTGAPTEWDVKSGKNVKWVADLGSQSYGNPSVGGGVVIIGTNNELARDATPADRWRHFGVVDDHDTVAQAVLQHAAHAVDDRLEAAFVRVVQHVDVHPTPPSRAIPPATIRGSRPTRL